MSDHETLKPVRGPLHGEDAFALNPEFVQDVVAALEEGRDDYVRDQVLTLHYADAADLIDQLPREPRERLLDLMRPGFNPEILPELDDRIRDEVLERYGYADFASLVAELDSDDAVYLVDQLDEAERAHVLARLPAEERTVIEQGLAFPEYTAGRLMQRELVAVPAYWTVGETIDYLRANASLPEDFYVLFVVDPRHRPQGIVRLSALLRSPRATRLQGLVTEEDMVVMNVTMDQEEVAYLFRQRDLLSSPVVDASGRLVGRITIDDVVDVIDEEAEDDMLKMAKVGEADLYAPAFSTAGRRIRWLAITLLNTILASFVISRFEATLEQIVALAILMPIVAAMGGNAGMQVVTVMVRALATKELGPGNMSRVIGKELAVGAINGVVFAAVLGTVAFLWFGRLDLGIVLSAAMIFNMVWAGMAGTLIPLTLAKMKIDPALAAGPFLTTTTDVLGFFAFLGLATLFLI
ncbi:MAG: magnesium transporter [Rhodospirillaceae bacterium BRH_c57]|nr:MAG: magnesium transporter [Rhodospirillaceae bacterium BRH_c57]